MPQPIADPAGRTASNWVSRFLPGVSAGGTVLDVACGGGRHLRLAHAAGHPVIGIDRNLADVADLMDTAGVTLLEADLEAGAPFPLSGKCFAGVIVTNYLWRPILPDIVRAVADDGILIYETFALGHERHGRPVSPDFLLAPNELIHATAETLVIIAYQHGVLPGDRPKILARIAAVGRGHPWAGREPVLLPTD